MKILKVMSIIGLVLSGFSWMLMSIYATAIDYMAGIGWGMIAMFYLIALCIVCLVQVKKKV